MNQKKIKKLTLISFKNNSLDKKIVNKIAAQLSKKDLKKYINELKLHEKKNNILVSSPQYIQKSNNFKKLFPNKKIIFEKDPNLMLGIKIVDNDTIYEFTLKSTIDKIIRHMQNNYD
jgi:hypothetical protein